MDPFAEIYSRPEIAAAYRSNLLQAPEAELLRVLRDRQVPADMLDLGVGAGRTSFFFLPFVRSYLGVDIAPSMIGLCRERFSTLAKDPAPCFREADAAALPFCADGAFDVVLFSCNGLDCLDPVRRANCLAEIHRVLRPGGRLLFSSHNLQAIPAHFGSHGSAAPGVGAERLAAIRRHNRPIEPLAREESALFWDGVYGDDGRLRHVYVRPREQVRVLAQGGFTDIRVLSSVTGQPLAETDYDCSEELSLHYFAARA